MKHLIELETDELLALASTLQHGMVVGPLSNPRDYPALVQAVAKVDREATEWLYDQRVSRGGWVDPIISRTRADALEAIAKAHPSL